MEKQFGKNSLGVHLMMGGGVKYALCGFPETVEAQDKEAADMGNLEPTSETVVTCPTCSYIIKNCRGVIIGEDQPDIFDPEGAKRYPYTAAVEMYLGGIGRGIYIDGTEQFLDQDVTPGGLFPQVKP